MANDFVRAVAWATFWGATASVDTLLLCEFAGAPPWLAYASQFLVAGWVGFYIGWRTALRWRAAAP
jgi:hypothetical protein